MLKYFKLFVVLRTFLIFLTSVPFFFSSEPDKGLRVLVALRGRVEGGVDSSDLPSLSWQFRLGLQRTKILSLDFHAAGGEHSGAVRCERGQPISTAEKKMEVVSGDARTLHECVSLHIRMLVVRVRILGGGGLGEKGHKCYGCDVILGWNVDRVGTDFL